MTIITVSEPTLRIPLEQIRVAGNFRTELRQEDVDGLAGSIELLGVLQPVLVAPIPETDDGHVFELVAGFTRYAAYQQLGLTDIPEIVRDSHPEDAAASRGAENVVRRQLNPYDEATALRHSHGSCLLSDTWASVLTTALDEAQDHMSPYGHG